MITSFDRLINRNFSPMLYLFTGAFAAGGLSTALEILRGNEHFRTFYSSPDLAVSEAARNNVDAYIDPAVYTLEWLAGGLLALAFISAGYALLKTDRNLRGI